MLDWIRRTFRSSIGKKALVALTGLLLAGFLVFHLSANLTLFADDTGETFTHYAESIEGNPLLPVAEIGLALLFLAHIVMAVRVSLQNREARGSAYRVRGNRGARTAGSATMILTGLVVLLFLLVHLWDFRFTKDHAADLAPLVRERLTGVTGFLIYLAGVAALGLHLSHGLRSALQSLGANHPKYELLIRRGGTALALLFALGFASFPIVYFLGGNR